ncbi:MAG TPA: hypothetical protein VF746_06460 [Longimicrobium sp.]
MTIRRLSVPAAPALAALLLTGGLAAQQPAADSVTPGRVVAKIATRADAGRSYALYLPSAYTREKTWPLLILMDPRGRAMVPMELFREAAERNGWVLMSSYNTLSDADSAATVNDASLDAMLLDAQQNLSIDTRRLYLAGFSGTARHAWGTAVQLDGNLAGIVAVGAGFPSQTGVWRAMLPRLKPFAVYNTVGDLDFNHDEMFAVDTLLAATHHPHRLVTFAGPHSWPPKEVAAEALEWLQLQAMKSGLAPRDEPWIDSVLAARLARARALEAAGAGVDALREYRSLVADFGGLRDVAEAEARRIALERDRGVQRAAARRDALAARWRPYSERLLAWLAEVRSEPRLPPQGRSLATLEVERLKREAADSTDRDAAMSARRLLALAFAWTGGLEQGRYMSQRDYARAVYLLRIAEAIRPRDPGVCYSLARALAQSGETDPALDALACAVDSGRLPAATLANDRLLDPLRQQPRFAEIAGRMPRT